MSMGTSTRRKPPQVKHNKKVPYVQKQENGTGNILSLSAVYQKEFLLFNLSKTSMVASEPVGYGTLAWSDPDQGKSFRNPGPDPIFLTSKFLYNFWKFLFRSGLINSSLMITYVHTLDSIYCNYFNKHFLNTYSYLAQF